MKKEDIALELNSLSIKKWKIVLKTLKLNNEKIHPSSEETLKQGFGSVGVGLMWDSKTNQWSLLWGKKSQVDKKYIEYKEFINLFDKKIDKNVDKQSNTQKFIRYVQLAFSFQDLQFTKKETDQIIRTIKKVKKLKGKFHITDSFHIMEKINKDMLRLKKFQLFYDVILILNH